MMCDFTALSVASQLDMKKDTLEASFCLPVLHPRIMRLPLL